MHNQKERKGAPHKEESGRILQNLGGEKFKTKAKYVTKDGNIITF